MTNGTQSIYDAYKSSKNSTSSNASLIYRKSNNLQKDVFVPVTDSTRRIPNNTFIVVISELMSVNNEKASKIILDGYISVNGNIVSDTLFTLNVGDIIRGGSVGHYLRGSSQMAVIS